MKRVLVLYDGLNLYHAICCLNEPSLKWLDLYKLSQEFIRPNAEQLVGVVCFTAYIPWDKEGRNRHRLYLKALQSTGVRIVLGKFQLVQRRCRVCNGKFQTYEEKKTDANIVAHLMGEAAKDSFDTAMIFSADSDLVAVIDGIRSYFPQKRLGFVFPPGLKSHHLLQSADFVNGANRGQLRRCMLPLSVTLPTGAIISRPPSWA